MLRKVLLCERWVGDWTEQQHIDPHSSVHSRISFPFSWVVQPGAWGPSLCWDMVLIPASSLHLIWTSCCQGYIIICRPPTSCERHIYTLFEPSTVKVMPRHPRPDAPVIYTGTFFLLTICYTNSLSITLSLTELIMLICLHNVKWFRVLLLLSRNTYTTIYIYMRKQNQQ